MVKNEDERRNKSVVFCTKRNREKHQAIKQEELEQEEFLKNKGRTFFFKKVMKQDNESGKQE